MKVSTVIKKMLLENTGIHMLDSGGGNGRHWQRNQGRDFDKEPTATLDFNEWTSKDTGEYNLEVYPSASTYHFLCSALSFDDQCKVLQKDFNKYCKKSDSCYLADMEGWLESKGWTFQTTNTYNFDNSLDQVLQYCTFKLSNERFQGYDDDLYILLQIHGGADVRGGYTKPVIFKLDIEAWYRMDDIYTNAGIDFHGPDIIESESGRCIQKDIAEYFEVKDGKLYVKATGELAEAYTID